MSLMAALSTIRLGEPGLSEVGLALLRLHRQM